MSELPPRLLAEDILRQLEDRVGEVLRRLEEVLDLGLRRLGENEVIVRGGEEPLDGVLRVADVRLDVAERFLVALDELLPARAQK